MSIGSNVKKALEVLSDMSDNDALRLASEMASDRRLNVKDLVRSVKADPVKFVTWAANRDWPRVEAFIERIKAGRKDRVEVRQKRRAERKDRLVARKAKRASK